MFDIQALNLVDYLKSSITEFEEEMILDKSHEFAMN